jgi:PBP1b-binding outer membrane lipoprotein LpoB
MKKISIAITILINIFWLSACTQVVTAPIKVAGAVVGTAVDVVTPDGD